MLSAPLWRTLGALHICGANRKLPAVPVDPAPPARAAGMTPHTRKLAFLFGAGATLVAVLLIQQIVAQLI